MRPFSAPDGDDFPGLIDELVPSLAAECDDLVVGFEDTVREPIATHELPDVFDRVQFGRPWRQGHQRDVGRDGELVRGVPSGLIEEDDGVGSGRHLG